MVSESESESANPSQQRSRGSEGANAPSQAMPGADPSEPSQGVEPEVCGKAKVGVLW